jgi:ADP-ribose pyrophosphatase YjhB (NUDIX family)
MMYVKIYFDDRPLFLCDVIDETIRPFIHHDDAVFIDELDAHMVRTMIHEMQQTRVHAGVFYHQNLDELKNAVFKKFTVVRAAGGLVKNDSDHILMIFRRGKWDLPKGKLDPQEKLEDCALREVEEETGMKNVELSSALTVTYHTYYQGTKHMLKESHWFMMNGPGQQTLTPQTEEDITDIKWIDSGNIQAYLAKAFPLIFDIIESARQKKFIAF